MYLAYLDAGSGSQIAMAVVAGFAGTMVAIKLWWRRLVEVVRRLFGRRPPDDLAAPTPAADQEAPAPADRDG